MTMVKPHWKSLIMGKSCNCARFSVPQCTFRFQCGVLQASGEAVYTSDVGLGGDELYAYPVESTQALATIESIDASKALQVQS